MALNELLDAVETCLTACDPDEGRDPHTPAAEGLWALRQLRAELEAYRTARASAGAFRRILVAVDDSEQSAWALRAAGGLARDLGAEVALVTVVDTAAPVAAAMAAAASAAGPLVGEPAVPIAPPGPTPEEQLAAGRKLLRLAQDELGGGVKVTRVVRDGQPRAEIVDAARERGADLVVVGAHARGRLARFIVGSTAEWVVRHAHCPVTVVAHDPAAREPAPPSIDLPTTVRAFERMLAH